MRTDSKHARPRGRLVAGAVGAVLAICAVALAVYFGTYYHATEEAGTALAGTEAVSVTEIDGGWLFAGTEGSADTALVFYPGAKVEAAAYAPLMAELAEAGVDCFLLTMPLRMAFLNMDAALDVVEAYEYETWILGGHSLGGAMAASCAADHAGVFDGLLLLAAYPTSSVAESVNWVVTIYGSEDGVLNEEKIEAGRAYMPEAYTELLIEGGNHAQFGAYGEQDGDGAATISAGEQRAAVVEALLAQLEAAA